MAIVARCKKNPLALLCVGDGLFDTLTTILALKLYRFCLATVVAGVRLPAQTD
jgi:hypothetical protein